MVSIIDDLGRYVRDNGLKSVRDIVGTVVDDEQGDGVVFMEAAP